VIFDFDDVRAPHGRRREVTNSLLDPGAERHPFELDAEWAPSGSLHVVSPVAARPSRGPRAGATCRACSGSMADRGLSHVRPSRAARSRSPPIGVSLTVGSMGACIEDSISCAV
jgi:hypothetical protein